MEHKPKHAILVQVRIFSNNKNVDQYELVVIDQKQLSEEEFKPKFQEIKKIELGLFKEKCYVIPVKTNKKSEYLFVIQCEFKQKNEGKFKNDDRYII